jgi:hypothetical protein
MLEKAASREFRARIEHVLLHEWDPCEVVDEPKAADEYNAYVYGVMQLLLAGAPVEAIEQHLAAIDRDRMGMSGEPSRRRSAAATALHSLHVPTSGSRPSV